MDELKPLMPNKTDYQTSKKVGRPIGMLVVVIIVAFIIGIVPRLRQRAAVGSETKELATSTVEVVSLAPAENQGGLLLPAEIKPWIEAPIYSRANGYLKKLLVDIGSKVKEGQLLAEIETPELDQELEQARNQFTQTQASLSLARLLADRSTKLAEKQMISTEENDEKQADLAVKSAASDAAAANVHRLEDLKSFANIIAPFAGIVTARKTNVGDLVRSADGTELFHLAQTNRLRIYTQVPQSAANGITAGQPAELSISNMPNKIFAAKVVRTAGAISDDSRTLLVELEADSASDQILAGSFAQVRFEQAKSQAALTLPANTLLFRAGGPQVAVVDADSKVEMHNVKLGRDFGKTVEIISGLSPSDRVVINPSDGLFDGMTVRVSQSPPKIQQEH